MANPKEIEAQAAAFRRLISHLQERTDVQNIDLMNLAGFVVTACQNGTVRNLKPWASPYLTATHGQLFTKCPTPSGKISIKQARKKRSKI